MQKNKKKKEQVKPLLELDFEMKESILRVCAWWVIVFRTEKIKTVRT